MYQKKETIENAILLVLDVLCLLVSVAAAFAIRYGLFYGRDKHGDQIWQVSFICLLLIVINVLINFNHHFFRRGFFEELIAVIKMQAVFSLSLIHI